MQTAREEIRRGDWAHSLDALLEEGSSEDFWDALWKSALRTEVERNEGRWLADGIFACALTLPYPIRLDLSGCGRSRALVTGGGIRFLCDSGRQEFVKDGDQIDLTGSRTVRMDPVRQSGSASCIWVTGDAAPRIEHSGTGVEDEAVEPPYYWGYDRRYLQTYAEGGLVWESLEPNGIVTRLVSQLIQDRENQPIIDLGCGEGRDSLWLAAKGYRVTGVDISSAALDRARLLAKNLARPPCFLERDVIRLQGIAPESFDLALNMGCLHMLDLETDREAHLRRTYEILRPGGMFLLNHCKADWLKGFWSVEDYDAVRHAVPDDMIPRRIRTADGQIRTVQMPVLRHKVRGEAELVAELAAAGFVRVDALEENTTAFGNSAIILCRKPDA